MTGFINVNKAAGVSSAREVAIIKRLTGKPCGHMGTLDPMASGVLPIGIGNACRLFDYFLNKRKTYVATFTFGVESDTLDTTGEIIRSDGRIPEVEEINGVLNKFTGEITQVAPRYSAKNINGRRGYQLAREGVQFTPPSKTVNIYSLECERVSDTDYRFYIECGGGTYVRSLGRDIAAELNTCAVMSALIRTQSGAFGIESAVKTQNLNGGNISSYIIPTETLLPFEEIHPTGVEAKRLFCGLSVESSLADGLYKIYSDEGFYGLAESNKSILKIRTKLC